MSTNKLITKKTKLTPNNPKTRKSRNFFLLFLNLKIHFKPAEFNFISTKYALAHTKIIINLFSLNLSFRYPKSNNFKPSKKENIASKFSIRR